MSFCSSEAVNTTTRNRRSPGWRRSHSRTPNPSKRGIFKSSNSIVGSGCSARSAKAPSPFRYATATSPFFTYRTGAVTPALENASFKSITSSGKSSATKIRKPSAIPQKIEFQPQPTISTDITCSRFNYHSFLKLCFRRASPLCPQQGENSSKKAEIFGKVDNDRPPPSAAATLYFVTGPDLLG